MINILDDDDYELAEGRSSVWVGVGPYSVYIHRTDEGLVVDVYQKDREMAETVASTWVLDSDLVPEGEDR